MFKFNNAKMNLSGLALYKSVLFILGSTVLRNYTTSINEEILTQPKTISSICSLQGQAVNTTYQGLFIIRYTDGTSEKMIQ